MRHVLGCLILALGTLWGGIFDLNAGQLPLYFERADGLDSEKKQDYVGALVHFKVLLILLEHIQEENPQWEHDLVLKDIVDSKAKIKILQSQATKQILEKMGNPLSSGSPVSMLYDEGCKEPDALKAMHKFEEYESTFEIYRQAYPRWEDGATEERIKKSKEQILHLVPKILKDAYPLSSDGHTVQSTSH